MINESLDREEVAFILEEMKLARSALEVTMESFRKPGAIYTSVAHTIYLTSQYERLSNVIRKLNKMLTL